MDTNVEEVLDGHITGIMNFGAFVKLENGDSGLVHISEISKAYVKDINTIVSVGDKVKIKVIKIDDNKKLSFSMKQVEDENNDRCKNQRPPRDVEFNKNKNSNLSFEDMMSKFKQSSEEKMSEFKKTVEFKKGNNRRGGR